MAFFPPVPLIRRVQIVKLLTKAKAFSEDSRKTFEEIGLVNSKGAGVTKMLIKQGI